MKTESTTRKKLGTTYTGVDFVCVCGNVAAFECGGQRVSFPLDALEIAVAEAVIYAKKQEMGERYRQSAEPNEFDQKYNF